MTNTPLLTQSGIHDVVFGSNVQVVSPVNLYGCCIGDNTFIGPFVEIQTGVAIGKQCRIQSHSFICDGVTVGDHVVVAHGVMFINDTFAIGGPAQGNKALWKKTVIGNRVSIGSNATILPVRIVDDVVVGAGSVVTKDILEPGIYAGNPARKIRAVHG